ncbi:hypothetical protein [Streptomyces sp. NPDC017673]|uniref:hypothetical protein n=1 Tax=unclassified Streptomyces TaxID=2593676 RepID=UPI0037996941
MPRRAKARSSSAKSRGCRPSQPPTLLLTVPDQLGVDYNARVIDSVLTHVALELRWR